MTSRTAREPSGARTAEDGEAPPTYNDATGTLDVQQYGVHTQSQMRDDGRLHIQIDETDSRLAHQIEQIQRPQSLTTTPAPASTPSPSSLKPPPLNVVVHVVGSRGDVQPFVALGKELTSKYGHRIRLATHGTFKSFVEENGLEFFDIGGDPAELMAFMVKNPGLIPGMESLKAGDVGKRRAGMAEILQGCWKSCADVTDIKEESNGGNVPKAKPFVANAIIANPPSFAHIHCAQKLGIPLHLMFTMPWSATTSFPHPLANIKSTTADGRMTNELSYTLVEMMTWEGLGDLINKFRTETLGLEMLSQAAAISMIHRLRIPYTYCWSPALIPKPKDWGANVTISGFYFLSLASNYTPDPDLLEFLQAGPPPVYIGFGSIVVKDPNTMTKLIFEAVERTGQRALVSKGWGGLGGDELDKPDGVFMLGNCPHDWLFQHVSAVVHHGGAGTTAAGIALGRPTVIVPFFGDQPFWGSMVARAGAGPQPVQYKDLTADGLANAILEALKPETLERATELGERIREEKGCQVGAESFHAQMDIGRMRCMMDPERAAVWRIKTTDNAYIRLSTFAASVLGNEGVLDMNNLKLYRPYNYVAEEMEIVSNLNSPNPVLSTAGSFASDLLHWPINIGKAWAGVVYQPLKGAKTDGWAGFGKGLKTGFGNLLFPQGGLLAGSGYSARALYEKIKKNMGDDKLSFILAVHFAHGFEEARAASKEERLDVVRRWNELSPKLKKQKSGASSDLSKTASRASGTTTRNEGGPSSKRH